MSFVATASGILVDSSLAEKQVAPERQLLDIAVVDEERALWRQFQRIGGNLTPQQVSQIIQEADTGLIERFVNLCNESRQKDGHLHSVLQTRELAIKGLEWSLRPPRDASDEEKKATQQLTAFLQDSENFPDLIHHLIGSGNYHGHATTETIYSREVVDGRVFLAPNRWSRIHSNRFAFSQSTGRLLFVLDDNRGTDLLAEYPGKFVRYQPIINGDAHAREGLARVLIWLALFRNWDLRDWLQYGEIGWKPWRIGTYSRTGKGGIHKDDVAILKKALKQLTTTGAAVLPDSVALNVEWPKGVGSTVASSHKELYSELGAEMSKTVLGQTLTTEQGNRGSQALGNVQDRVRGDILAADAIGLAQSINRGIVRPFYELNYAEPIRPCTFIFHTEDSVDLANFSAAVEKLTKAGVRIPADWIRNQGGIPHPKQGEEVVGGQQAEQVEPGTEDPEDD